MSETSARELFQRSIAPDEGEAEERAWRVVEAAFGGRQPVRWPRRRVRPILAFAVLAALVAAAASPPGRAVLGELRDAIGREKVVGVPRSKPALVSLPAAGRLLVVSPAGPWVVRRDGSKRRLGDYEGASWSPQGLFVVATRGHELVALEPDGEGRWSLSRSELVRDARWAPSGFRIAYRAGSNLRVVAGDGTGDRLLVNGVAVVAPAWRPGEGHVLAYADREGRVRLVDADSGEELWRTGPGARVRGLEWSTDGRRLLALRREEATVYRADGQPFTGFRTPGPEIIDAGAFRPGSHEVAYAWFSPATGRSRVGGGVSGLLFEGQGRFRDLTWSPDARWLLVAWPAADQLVFIRASDRKVVAASNVARELAPGRIGPVPFPRLAGWCCT